MLVDQEAKSIGLQDVYHLDWEQGAWFVFEDLTTSGFWMKNTPIPLELVFLDKECNVISIHELKPHDKRIIQCEQPYKYALEVNPGWCEAYNIKSGTNLTNSVDMAFMRDD